MKEKSFTMVPNKALLSPISAGAFRTLVTLLLFNYHKGYAFPSQSTIAGIQGITRETIVNHMRELKNAGFITTKKRGYSSSLIYTFNSEEKFTVDERRKFFFTSIGEATSPLKQKVFHTNNTKLRIKNKNKGYKAYRQMTEELAIRKRML